MFYLLTGSAQTSAKQVNELHGQHRLGFDKWKEVSPVDHDKLAIGVSNRIGRSRKPVEQRDLPEYLTFCHKIEDGAASLKRGDAHLDGAAHHDEETIAGISSHKDGRAAFELSEAHILA